MADLPEWAARAVDLQNGESIVIVDKRTQGQVSGTLQRIKAGETGKEPFKLRATVKPGIWLVCRKDWPHKFFAPRAPNKSGHNPAANLKAAPRTHD